MMVTTAHDVCANLIPRFKTLKIQLNPASEVEINLTSRYFPGFKSSRMNEIAVYIISQDRHCQLLKYGDKQ
jgi:hypothetical protein